MNSGPSFVSSVVRLRHEGGLHARLRAEFGGLAQVEEFSQARTRTVDATLDRAHGDAAVERSGAAVGLPAELTRCVGVGVDGETAPQLASPAQQPSGRVEPKLA